MLPDLNKMMNMLFNKINYYYYYYYYYYYNGICLTVVQLSSCCITPASDKVQDRNLQCVN